MAAITSAQAGNWSSTATWTGGVVPGTGDTVTIAHAVTLDQDATIGTSPNDTTTNVLTINASITFTAGTSRTLTIRGNVLMNSNCRLTMQAGANIVFNNSSSGGSPSYGFNGGNVFYLTISGSSGNRCSISAIAGQTWRFGLAWWSTSVAYCDFTRAAACIFNLFSGATHAWSYCTWTSCGRIEWGGSGAVQVTRNNWQQSTGTESTKLSTAATGNQFTYCVTDKLVTHASSSWLVASCVFAGGFIQASVAAGVLRDCFVQHDGALSGGNGTSLYTSARRCYWVVKNEAGNPHFVQPVATAASRTILQCVFESQTPDLVDTGDCVLVIGANVSGANTVLIANSLVLRSSYAGSGVSSGCLLTSYNNAVATEHILCNHNTCNIDNSVLPVSERRGAFALAEAGNGVAGQLASLKSNLVWGSSPLQGYIAERIGGTVDGLIKASGADRNCRHNLSDGNNGRGYHDRANSPGQDLWSTGNADGNDAADAAVDANQLTADPQFYDATRNVGTWANARGYGSGYSAGVTALVADPSRVADLLSFVFEGFSPTNATLRTAAHDGGCIGAANFRKTRDLTFLTSRETAFNAL